MSEAGTHIVRSWHWNCQKLALILSEAGIEIVRSWHWNCQKLALILSDSGIEIVKSWHWNCQKLPLILSEFCIDIVRIWHWYCQNFALILSEFGIDIFRIWHLYFIIVHWYCRHLAWKLNKLLKCHHLPLSTSQFGPETPESQVQVYVLVPSALTHFPYTHGLASQPGKENSEINLGLTFVTWVQSNLY